MSEHALTVRLDTAFESERRAWDKLKELHRKTHLSYSKIITDAVNAYDTDYAHLAPEDEARLVQQITDAVSEKLQQLLPVYLTGFSAGAASPSTIIPTMSKSVSEIHEQTDQHPTFDEADVEPNFDESVMDFDFMGCI